MDRRLGLAAATSAVVGQVIAVGIFLTPASMARTLGSPFWLLAAWLLMGGMALSGALAYGELAARFPEAGGGYVVAVTRGGPVAVADVNRALARMRADGTMHRLTRRWLGIDPARLRPLS